MTDANKKEMLAGLFLSKFSKDGLRRLGYASFKDAYKGLSNLVGGNPLSVRKIIVMSLILFSRTGERVITGAR